MGFNNGSGFLPHSRAVTASGQSGRCGPVLLHTLLLSVEDAEKQGLSMVTIWSNNNDNKKTLYHLRHFFSCIFNNNNNNNKDREETSNV